MGVMLSVKDLVVNYGAINAIKGISFDVNEGEIVTLIGANGAGKSTTLKSILGLVHPDGGDVRFFGQDVRQHEREFKEQIGVVLGGIDFYPKKKVKTITDVTRRFYRNWDETKYRHYLELFRIDESKRVDQLSSGMKVKYLLALALSHNAKLLILDEPTSGLDPVSRDELVALFRAIVADGQRSILFSTHITSDLEKCASHITFIKDGEIFHSSTVAEFMAAYADRGATLEDIIVSVERRELDDSAII